MSAHSNESLESDSSEEEESPATASANAGAGAMEEARAVLTGSVGQKPANPATLSLALSSPPQAPPTTSIQSDLNEVAQL